MPKKKTITPTFWPGDKVWHIYEHCEQEKVRCKYCRKGVIVAENRETLVCPKCEGKKSYTVVHPLRWVVSQTSYIVAVGYFELSDIELDGTIELREHYNLRQSLKREAGYGTHPAKDLFASEEEALEECDRRNEGRK